MPEYAIRYTGPVRVSVPSLGVELEPGDTFHAELEEEQAAVLFSDPSGNWEQADDEEPEPPAAAASAEPAADAASAPQAQAQRSGSVLPWGKGKGE